MILLSTQERRLTFGPTASAWNEASGSASTLSSRAGNRAPPSVHWRRSTLPTILITPSSCGSDPASRITFYIQDEALGPMVMCVDSFLPFQTATGLFPRCALNLSHHQRGF